MSELKDLQENDTSGKLLRSAVYDLPDALIDEITRNWVDKGEPVEITLTVNGREVPFSATINESFSTWSEKRDKFVLDKALELIDNAGLRKLIEVFDNLQENIEDRLKEALKGN